MSLTRIISSWSSSNVVVRTSSGFSPTSEHLLVGTGDPGRRLPQPLTGRVLPDRFEDLRDGRLDARTVERHRSVETRLRDHGLQLRSVRSAA